MAPAMDIMHKLCEAIDCIHMSHLIHRDIKADNIIVTTQGEPRLMDFGIALAQGQTRLTGIGYGMGTPESAAPEQIGGGAVTKAVDIYALGILVFHMMTGRRPFEGDIAHVLYAQANETPPELRTLRPDASPALDAAVRLALAKRPEDRPVSAGAFWAIATGRAP
jgi:eukaryotic-like serine/threonine-protein kinase